MRYFLIFTIILFYSSCDYKDLSPESTSTVPEQEKEILTESFKETKQIRHTIESSLKLMSPEQKISQLLMIQLRYTEQGRPLRILENIHISQLSELQPGGVILFGENIYSPLQTIRFIHSVHGSVPGIPPLIAVDQEGGLVDRLDDGPEMVKSTTRIPSAWILAQGGPEAGFAAGTIIGQELRALGITMNLAPIADLSSAVHQSFLGSRTFGGDPYFVGQMVGAFIEGLTNSRVSSVTKHYPGHGDTVLDSHHHPISFPENLNELKNHALIPFKMAIDAGTSGIMAAHISYPNIDTTGYPASISPILLEEILRNTLDFQGLIITDALEMQGIRQFMNPDDASVQAILAGADMILTPANPWPTFHALLEAYHSGILTEQRLNQSVRRILHHKATWGTGIDFSLTPEQRYQNAEQILGSQESAELLAKSLR